MATSSDSDGSNGRRSYFWRSSKAKTYECKICGNEFKSGQSLGGHMNVHRKDQRSSRSSRSSIESSNYGSSSADSSVTFKGVRYRSEQDKWVAEIRPPRSSKTWWLGTYDTAIEAAYAYDVAITYFNSETSLNFDGHPVYDQIPKISPNLPKEDFAVQLRKVVKEYGKLAMQSDPSPDHQVVESEEDDEEEEEEEEASSSSPQEPSDSFDDVIDWNAALAGPPFMESDTTQNYHPYFDDVLDQMPQCDSYGAYHNPEPANYPTSAYNQMSNAMPDYDPSGHYNYGYGYPQQQLWSYYGCY